MVLSNKTVLIEQYANDKGLGWGVKGAMPPPPEAETHV